LLRHERDRFGRERLEVDPRHAVRARERVGEPLLGDEAELVEAGAEPPAVEHLVLDRLLQLSVGDHPAVAQDPSQDRQKRTSSKAAILTGPSRPSGWRPRSPALSCARPRPCPSPSPPTTSGSRTSSASSTTAAAWACLCSTRRRSRRSRTSTARP